VSEYQEVACTGRNPVQAGLEGVQLVQPACTQLQGGFVPVGVLFQVGFVRMEPLR
jgi:hypothetical protein